MAFPEGARARVGIRNPLSRESFRRLGELFVLCGFVVAQPLFDVFGKSPDVFVFRNADRVDIIELAVLLLVGPALALWGVESLVAIVSDRAAVIVHRVMLGALAVLFLIPIFKRASPLRGVAAGLLALALGVLFVYAHLKARAVRLWLTVGLPIPLVFGLIFLLVSPVSPQVLPRKAAIVGASTVTARGTSVVMVVLDEFPLASLIDSDGQIDADLYPNFTKLAAMSTFYNNATTNAWYTPFGLPAILTGSYPSGKRVPTSIDYPNNLFTLFGRSFRHNVYEILHLCPTTLCQSARVLPGRGGFNGIARDALSTWRTMVSPNDSSEDPTATLLDETFDATAADRDYQKRFSDPKKFGIDVKLLDLNQPTRFTEFLTSLRSTEEPSINFLHLLLPHAPWRYLPDGRQYPRQATPGLVGGKWTGGVPAVIAARQRHLLQVQYVDRLLGQLIKRLKDVGLWDRSAFVLTADHGIGFTPGEPKREVTDKNYEQLAWVPLFVKAPKQSVGRTNSDNVQSVDIVPTIAQMLRVKIPWKIDGRSLLSAPRPLDEARVLYTAPGVFRMIDGVAGLRLTRAGAVDSFAPREGGLFRIFRHGPYGLLVGRPSSSIGSPHPSASVKVANRDAYRNVGRLSIPAFLQGTARGIPPGRTLAITLNGVVAAAVDTFRRADGASIFAAMLPESLLRRGANDISVYLVEGTPSAPVLRALSFG